MEINIQKKSSKCLRCEAEFQHEEKHHSLLKIEDKEFLREDYCLACWAERSEKGKLEDLYSCWETRHVDPSVAAATPQEQFVPMLNLCYKSVAEGGEDGEAMAYMCALILRRQKIFRFVREEQQEPPDSRSVLVFFDKHNDTQVRIVDPGLADAKLMEVKRKLEEIIAPGQEEQEQEEIEQ